MLLILHVSDLYFEGDWKYSSLRDTVCYMDRLSLVASREFASLFRLAMRDCDVASVYSMYLLTDLPRPTVYRWLSGAVRIPIGGAQTLVNALLREPGPKSLEAAVAFLAEERSREYHSCEARLRTELKVRKLPVERTVAALRASGILGPSATRD